MSLNLLEEEAFEHILNSGIFKIIDHGPLYSPVNNFEIKRNNKKELILTTYSNKNSQKDILRFPEFPSGTIFSLDDHNITLSGSNMTVIAKGAWSRELLSETDYKTRACIRKEISWIDTLEAIPENTEQVHQLIEWVDNLDTSLFIWPHYLEEKREISTTRIFDNKTQKLKQRIKQNEYLSIRRYLGLNIDGNEICIVPLRKL